MQRLILTCSPSSSSRLRLAAALAILKLAATPVYQNSIAERFELFARTAQVSRRSSQPDERGVDPPSSRAGRVLRGPLRIHRKTTGVPQDQQDLHAEVQHGLVPRGSRSGTRAQDVGPLLRYLSRPCNAPSYVLFLHEISATLTMKPFAQRCDRFNSSSPSCV